MLLACFFIILALARCLQGGTSKGMEGNMNQFYRAMIMAGIPIFGHEVCMRKQLEEYLVKVHSLQKKFEALNV